MITFDRVTYTYPEAGQPALRDVSLELPEATFTLLVGPLAPASPPCCAAPTGWCPISTGDRCEDPSLSPARIRFGPLPS